MMRKIKMAEQIIINDKDPQKQDMFDEFFKESADKRGGKYLDREVVLTDSDYENLFTKIASRDEVNNFSEFKNVVHETFDGKLDDQVSR